MNPAVQTNPEYERVHVNLGLKDRDHNEKLYAVFD